MTLHRHQMPFLQAIADASAPLTAKQISAVVFTYANDQRSVSASVAGNMWQMIRAGYATRSLIRRELYGYSITDAGRAVLAKARGETQ